MPTPTAEEFSEFLQEIVGPTLQPIVCDALGVSLARFVDDYSFSHTARPRIARVEHLKAHNDVNGNPRRCYIGRAEDGAVLAVVDEGYSGPNAALWVRAAYRDNYAGIREYAATVREYQEALTLGRSLSPYLD
jgi:hypothetical protein